MCGNSDSFGMGWLKDYPDFRDYTPDQKAVAPLLGKVKAARVRGAKAQGTADLRTWFSPVEDQKSIGSCTAHAGVGILEYFERRAFGKHVDASRLFLYKATRNLMKASGDTGAYLRTTMGALVLFGVPPEKYWPYSPADYDLEPPAFCYAFARRFQAVSYYRLDPPGTPKDALLGRIRANLAAGLPSLFGFTVYDSVSQAAATGRIPFPAPGEKVAGGHAVVAAGYDDGMKIRNAGRSGPETKGALLIRNSWGTGWGEKGYGWLPYDYVLRGLAEDWWTLIAADWIDTGAFGV